MLRTFPKPSTNKQGKVFYFQQQFAYFFFWLPCSIYGNVSRPINMLPVLCLVSQILKAPFILPHSNFVFVKVFKMNGTVFPFFPIVMICKHLLFIVLCPESNTRVERKKSEWIYFDIRILPQWHWSLEVLCSSFFAFRSLWTRDSVVSSLFVIGLLRRI